MWNREDITEKLYPLVDSRMASLKTQWLGSSQQETSYRKFLPLAQEWFRSTTNKNLQGWDSFPCVDVTMGCTHYIESFILKHGWNGFQILKNEYAYYTLMGKHGVEVDDLEHDKPLIITMPHWHYCDLRPEWDNVLKICEQRNIDIHIDMAWAIVTKDIELDFNHPSIKSFAMSMSKYGLQWSRVGLRWSRQKSMDSVTIFNDYYKETNTVLTSAGAFFVANLPCDYAWDTHGKNHIELCHQLGLESTKVIHVAREPDTKKPLGIGKMLGETTPDHI